MSAAARGRGLRPGGVARALFRLVLFVVLGFGVGLVFGLVTEEPDLLAGHLSGEGQEVALEREASGTTPIDTANDAPHHASSDAATDRPPAAPPETATDLPRVAAARRIDSAEADPVPRASARTVEASAIAARPAGGPARPVAALRPIPETTRVAARNAPPAWAIQVGAFSDRVAAERLAEGLRGRYPVDVLPAREQGGRWRVRVQPIEDEARARSLADRLKQDERLPTWVTRMEARPGS